jgi:hypothetical protein
MKKVVLFVVALVALFSAFTGIALAASPQDIYNDYLADGKLDGTYTPAELRAYLGDATLDQYGDPALLTALDGIAQSMLNQGGGQTDGHSEFPFTGFQLALMALVVVALVGGGFGLRRLGRNRG